MKDSRPPRRTFSPRAILRFFLFSLVSFISLTPFVSFAEEISDFTAHIEMRADGTVFVQEEIIYDFGEIPKHGIFRDIPLLFRQGSEDAEIELANISVTNEKGVSQEVKTNEGGNHIALKIGDPDTTVTGKNLYVIRYTVYGAIRFLPLVDELYWNVTGNEWTVPIARTRIEVILPKDFPNNDVKRSCYKGSVGSMEGCTLDIAAGTATGTVHAVRALALGMIPHEGVTIAVGLPKGSVAQTPLPGGGLPKAPSKFLVYFQFLLPAVVLLLMLYEWYLYGRDPDVSTIVPMYEPPEEITPAEAALLSSKTVGSGVVTAELIYLAVRGYFSIRRIDKKGLIFTDHDYALMGRKSFTDLKGPDRLLMNGFFGMDDAFPDGPVDMYLSRLKESGKLPGLVGSFSSEIGKSLAQRGYFVEDPGKIRLMYLAGGIGVGILGFFMRSMALPIIVSGVVIVVIGWFMPKLTAQGARARDHVLGFRRYLSVAEKDRLEFHNAPNLEPTTFEKYLPYALALGVSDEWTKQFAGFYAEKAQSSWYSSSTGTLSLGTFAKDMSTFVESAGTSLSPSGGASGGGGFSGGGAGGGGGGSW